MAASPRTLYSIQVLRAIAAAAVVSYHVLKMLVHNGGYTFDVPSIGSSGVDLFFVISGFIMVYTSYEAFQQPHASQSFLRRRIIRIVPMYWLCTTAVVMLLVSIPALFTSSAFDWYRVITSYLFLLSTSPTGEIGTLLQTGWTLCFEIYFYLIFAILLNFSRRYFLLVSGLVFLIGVSVGLVVDTVPVWLTVTSNPILFEFYLGAVIAFAFINRVYLQSYLAIMAVLFSVVMIFLTQQVDLGQWTRFVCWGLPSVLLLWGVISLEHAGLFKCPRLLVSLGASSYSLYLVHPFLLPALGKIWFILHLSQKLPAAMLFTVAFLGSLIFGHLIYLLVEKPLTEKLSKAWKDAQ